VYVWFSLSLTVSFSLSLARVRALSPSRSITDCVCVCAPHHHPEEAHAHDQPICMRTHLNLLFYLNDNEVAGGVSEKEPWSVVEEVSEHSPHSRAGPYASGTSMPTRGTSPTRSCAARHESERRTVWRLGFVKSRRGRRPGSGPVGRQDKHHRV
jgi:hypothetical protein